jgi:hypothetical protein
MIGGSIAYALVGIVVSCELYARVWRPGAWLGNLQCVHGSAWGASREAGFTEHLVKPVEPSELVGAIRRVAKRAGCVSGFGS